MKVCGRESAIFNMKLMFTTVQISTTAQHLHSFKFTLVDKADDSIVPNCFPLCKMPFSNLVSARGLVLIVIGLKNETKLLIDQ